MEARFATRAEASSEVSGANGLYSGISKEILLQNCEQQIVTVEAALGSALTEEDVTIEDLLSELETLNVKARLTKSDNEKKARYLDIKKLADSLSERKREKAELEESIRKERDIYELQRDLADLDSLKKNLQEKLDEEDVDIATLLSELDALTKRPKLSKSDNEKKVRYSEIKAFVDRVAELELKKRELDKSIQKEKEAYQLKLDLAQLDVLRINFQEKLDEEGVDIETLLSELDILAKRLKLSKADNEKKVRYLEIKTLSDRIKELEFAQAAPKEASAAASDAPLSMSSQVGPPLLAPSDFIAPLSVEKSIVSSESSRTSRDEREDFIVSPSAHVSEPHIKFLSALAIEEKSETAELSQELDAALKEKYAYIDKIPHSSERFLLELIRDIEMRGLKEYVAFSREILDVRFADLRETLMTEELSTPAFEAQLKSAQAHFNVSPLQARKNLESLLTEIRPFNIEETLRLIGKAEEASNRIAGKDVVLILGNTGAGKSTTIHFLGGSTLEERKVPGTDKIHVEAVKIVNPQLKEVKVGGRSISETLYITPIDIDHDGESVVLCDTPGFGDSRSAEVDVANGIGIVAAVSKCKSVKPLILQSADDQGGRMQGVKGLAHQLANMMPGVKDWTQTFSYIFNKYDPKAALNLRASLEEVNTSLKEDEKADVAFHSILKDLIRKMKSRDSAITYLYPLTASPDDRDILLTSLTSHSIPFPGSVFRSSITPSSMGVIDSQLRRNREDILAAIKRCDFKMIQYRLDQMLRLDQKLHQQAIKQVYVDCVRDVARKLQDLYSGQQAALGRALSAGNQLLSGDIDQYNVTLKRLNEAEVLKSHLLHGPDKHATDSALLSQLLVSSVDRLIQGVKNDKSDIDKTKHHLDKLKLLAGSFGFLNERYVSACKMLLDECREIGAEAEALSLLSVPDFSKYAAAMDQLLQYQVSLASHLDHGAVDAIYQGAIAAANTTLDTWVKKGVALLSKDRLFKGDRETLRQCLAVLDTAQETVSLNKHIPSDFRQQCYDGPEGLMSKMIAYFDQFPKKISMAMVPSSETPQKSFGPFFSQASPDEQKQDVDAAISDTLLNCKQLMEDIDHLREISSDLRSRTAETYERMRSDLILHVKSLRQEVEAILKDLSNPEACDQRKLVELNTYLVRLIRAEWIESLQEGLSADIVRTCRLEIQFYAETLLKNIKRITFEIRETGNFAQMHGFLKRLRSLASLEASVPGIAAFCEEAQKHAQDQMEILLDSVKSSCGMRQEVDISSGMAAATSSSMVKSLQLSTRFFNSSSMHYALLALTASRVFEEQRTAIVRLEDQLKSATQSYFDNLCRELDTDFIRVESMLDEAAPAPQINPQVVASTLYDGLTQIKALETVFPAALTIAHLEDTSKKWLDRLRKQLLKVSDAMSQAILLENTVHLPRYLPIAKAFSLLDQLMGDEKNGYGSLFQEYNTLFVQRAMADVSALLPIFEQQNYRVIGIKMREMQSLFPGVAAKRAFENAQTLLAQEIFLRLKKVRSQATMLMVDDSNISSLVKCVKQFADDREKMAEAAANVFQFLEGGLSDGKVLDPAQEKEKEPMGQSKEAFKQLDNINVELLTVLDGYIKETVPFITMDAFSVVESRLKGLNETIRVLDTTSTHASALIDLGERVWPLEELVLSESSAASDFAASDSAPPSLVRANSTSKITIKKKATDLLVMLDNYVQKTLVSRYSGCSIEDYFLKQPKRILDILNKMSQIHARYARAAENIQQGIIKNFNERLQKIQQSLPVQATNQLVSVGTSLDFLPDTLSKLLGKKLAQVQAEVESAKKGVADDIEAAIKADSVEQIEKLHQDYSANTIALRQLENAVGERVKQIAVMIVTSCDEVPLSAQLYKRVELLLNYYRRLNKTISTVGVQYGYVQDIITKKFTTYVSSIANGLESANNASAEQAALYKTAESNFNDLSAAFLADANGRNVYRQLMPEFVAHIEKLYDSFVQISSEEQSAYQNNLKQGIVKGILHGFEVARCRDGILSKMRANLGHVRSLLTDDASEFPSLRAALGRLTAIPGYETRVTEIKERVERLILLLQQPVLALDTDQNQQVRESCYEDMASHFAFLKSFSSSADDFDVHLKRYFKEGIAKKYEDIQKRVDHNIEAGFQSAMTALRRKPLSDEDYRTVDRAYNALLTLSEKWVDFQVKAAGHHKAMLKHMQEMIRDHGNAFSALLDVEDESNNSKITSILVLVKELGIHLVSMAKPAQKKVEELLKRYQEKKGSAALTTLGLTLSEEGGATGHAIMQECTCFRGNLIEEQNRAMGRQGIEYVLDNLEGTDTDVRSKFELRQFYDRCMEEYTKSFRRYLARSAEPSGLDPLLSTIFIKADEAKGGKDAKVTQWTPRMSLTVPSLVADVFALWTLQNSQYYHDAVHAKDRDNFLMRPHPAQIISIFRMLGLDTGTPGQMPHHFIQIGTGEGKSVTLAVSSAILALLGFDVSCACYSEYLSQRDYSAFKSLFDLLRVSDHIHYDTFPGLATRIINERVDVCESVQALMSNGQRPVIRLSAHREKILLIDEVDTFFDTEFYGNVYTPGAPLKHPTISALIVYIWTERERWKSQDDQLNMKTIQRSLQYAACKAHFGHWSSLLDEAVKDMLAGVKAFQSQRYVLQDGRIGYPQQDGLSFNVSYGFNTVYAYFHEHEQGKVTQAKLEENTVIDIHCGSFSYAHVVEQFKHIMGVTGTLRTLNSVQRSIMEQNYQIKRETYSPSVYGANNLSFTPGSGKGIFIENQDDYHARILQEINDRLQGKTAGTQRAALVFFETQDKLKAFYNSPVFSARRDAARIMTEELNPEERQQAVLLAARAGQVTLLTRTYGRGTDFACRDKQVASNGGLHVIQTFLSEELSEEVQMKGRTARQGAQGSYSMVLLENELERVGVVAADLSKIKLTGEAYAVLDPIRNAFFAAKYKVAVGRVVDAAKEHAWSMSFIEALVRGDDKSVREFLLKRNEGAALSMTSSTVILMDATGSMSALLDKAKSTVRVMFERARVVLADSGMDPNGFSVQFAVYRNYSSGQENILQSSGFESNPEQLRKFMDGIRPDGGQGNEAVEIGLWHACEQSHNRTINQVILIGDAPANNRSVRPEKDEVLFKRAGYKQQRGVANLGGLLAKSGEDYWKDTPFRHPTDWEAETKRLADKGIPVRAFYVAPYAKSNFEQIADRTKGDAKFLDVNSPTGADLLVHAVTEQILQTMAKSAQDAQRLVENYRKKFGGPVHRGGVLASASGIGIFAKDAAAVKKKEDPALAASCAP